MITKFSWIVACKRFVGQCMLYLVIVLQAQFPDTWVSYLDGRERNTLELI
jgi:hypothetical protein